MQPTQHANARLIAAAPELLEACRLLLAAVNEHHKDGSILWVSPGTTAWELLTDVIEKATGEESSVWATVEVPFSSETP